MEDYLGIIKAEMMVEGLDTVNRNFIQEIVLRAGGKISDVDEILKHPSVREIDDDMFYFKK